MATWSEIESAAPELAGRARAAFDAHKHKVLATLRRDGSPRISGIEATITDGELWLGMMPGSRKALDLRRDPRLALHSASDDPPDDPTAWTGDAKLSGRAVRSTTRPCSRSSAPAARPATPTCSASTSPSWSTPGSATPPTISSSTSGRKAPASARCGEPRCIPTTPDDDDLGRGGHRATPG